MQQSLEENSFRLKFVALRNAHYHMAREKWFVWWDRIITYLIILAGTGVVSSFLNSSALLGFLIAALGGAQLVFDCAGGARIHNGLRKRYLEMAASIERQEACDDVFCRKIDALHANIMMDEPPVYRALEALAHNQITDALLGKDGEKDKSPTKWYHWILRHVYTFPDSGFTDSPAAKDSPAAT
jgi:hypothetical protein